MFQLFVSRALGPEEARLSWFPLNRRTHRVLWMFLTSTSSSGQIVTCSSVLFLQRRLNPSKTLWLQDIRLLPQLQSEPGLFCIFHRTAASAFTFVRTQNRSWKYTQQEDTTITVMPVYFTVFNVLQKTVAERSVEAVSPAPHWMSHTPPSSSVKLNVWGLDDTNTTGTAASLVDFCD